MVACNEHKNNWRLTVSVRSINGYGFQQRRTNPIDAR